MSGEDWPHLFGVRHLSPAGAWHVLRFLERIRPTLLLVEGPADATDLLPDLLDSRTTPPVALLAYTTELPVRTLLCPFAVYSPEWQALCWAKEHEVEARFIDLPSEVMIPLEESCTAPPDETCTFPPETDVSQKTSTEKTATGEGPEAAWMPNLYETVALQSGENDFSSWWERTIEHNLNEDAYLEAVRQFGSSCRQLRQDHSHEAAFNALREAYMRREIVAGIAAGHAPEKIVVVCGAYHVDELGREQPPMTDAELDALPRAASALTLMPYTYLRLSSMAGYGAGNNAPAYYELLWRGMASGSLAATAGRYIARIATFMRQRGTFRSTAEVIEGVRLANTLSALRGGSFPVLQDLRDGVITCLGHGELGPVRDALADVEISSGVGSLPEGISRTSIQEDFQRELKRLKLEKYKTTCQQSLSLDLRENRRVHSEAAAFLDLNRSFFLHRLKVLDISFQKEIPVSKDQGTWAEAWLLQWSPTAEIELVESVLKGDTLEQACAFVFHERLGQGRTLAEVAEVIRLACLCGMPEALDSAVFRVQELAAGNCSFRELALVVNSLSQVLDYGDLRRFDTKPLEPILKRLFYSCCLLLTDAANCNMNAATDLIEAVSLVQAAANAHYALVNGEAWNQALEEVARRDNLNPRVSGFACALLIEKKRMPQEKLEAELSRRLSPGVPADLGAGWFEGLSLRNRGALLSNVGLWRNLDAYLATLDDTAFRRALVFLRRAFSTYSPADRAAICELLGEAWNVRSDDIEDAVSRTLSEAEQEQLDALNEFDFTDL